MSVLLLLLAWNPPLVSHRPFAGRVAWHHPRMHTEFTRPDLVPAGAGGDDALQLYKALSERSKEDSPLGRAIKQGLGVLTDALRLYGADRVVTSFNGGKDAVVIMHLMRAAMAGYYNDKPGGARAVRVIFFEQEDEFAEVEAFVQQTVARYGLELLTYDVGFVPGLTQCIEQHGTQAFVLGTRVGDPNAVGQSLFTPSSDWMPPFMRVNPVFEWGYAEVWAFLRQYGLPFCPLYCDGYTSIGKVSNTFPNPALKRPDGSYAAAWLLSDGQLERAGRDSARSSAGDEGGARLVRRVGMLVVGDEILKGSTADVNTVEAAKMLRRQGIRLCRVVTVADEIGEIVAELRRLRDEFDAVITSGGLGPTHDDITLRAIATALSVPFEESAEMRRTIVAKVDRSKSGRLDEEVIRKMSCLPGGAQLRAVPGLPDEWPILQCANVFILPGVPRFFSSKLGVILTHFLKGEAPPIVRSVSLRVGETEIVAALNRVVQANADITIGSYPVDRGDVKTILTVEAPHDALPQLEAAVAQLGAALPPNAVVAITEQVSLGEFSEAASSAPPAAL